MGGDFEKLAAIFEQARSLKAGARDAYIDQACGDDLSLREHVRALLERHDQAGMLDHSIGHGQDDRQPDPERIGQFRILDCLGRGSMGVVYRAQQDQPKRQVALKVMRAGLVSEEMKRRFAFESSVLARLQHPGIAHIFEVGTIDGPNGSMPFFAMELVEGVTLDRYVQRVQPTIAARIRLFIAICDAVQHAHRKGVIHRDLKPANVLVSSEGSPKILDFGVARATDAGLQATLVTSPGQLIGTLAYMSPEQVSMSTDQLDTRSDVYALGVILYELLAAQLPYELSSSRIASAVRVIEQVEPRSLAAVDRNLRGDLETIVQKALHKRPEDRYQSAADLAADLQRYLEHQPIVARPASAVYQLRRFARRHRGLVAGMAAAVFTLVAGTGAVAWQASRVRAEANTRRQVADFLREMLTSVDPAKTAGRPLTVRDMLDDVSANIDNRFAHARLVRGELHHTIGSTYHRLGAFHEAERHARAAVADLEDTAGAQAESTLLAMSSLGLILCELDRLEEAETILRQALSRLPGPDAVIADGIRQHLAIVLDDRGENTEAERLFRDVYHRILGRLGPEHPDTLRARSNLGKILLELRRFDEALPHLTECLRQRRSVLGDDHPHTISSIANLSALYFDIGRQEECTRLLHEAAERSERVLGPVHIKTLRRRQDLVRLEAFVHGNFEAAAAKARYLLQDSEHELGAEHTESIAALELLVTAMALGGDTDAAKALALEWYDRMNTQLGPTHLVTGRIAYLLQNLCEEIGERKEEEVWRGRVTASSFRPAGADGN